MFCGSARDSDDEVGFLFNKTAIFQDDRNVMDMGSQLSHQRWWLCRFFRVCFFFLHLFTFSVAFAQFSCKCIYKGRKVAAFKLCHAFQKSNFARRTLYASDWHQDIANYRKFNKFLYPNVFLSKKHTHQRTFNGVNAHSDKYWIEFET